MSDFSPDGTYFFQLVVIWIKTLCFTHLELGQAIPHTGT